MIAVDTNILVYAHREELPQHKAARRRVTQLANRDERWAIPVFCLGEFLRVVTHPRVFDNPHTTDEACQAIETLLESSSLSVLRPGDRYERLLVQAMRDGEVVGNLVFDAQIVALCREHGVVRLLTSDRDFDRFRDLQLVSLAKDVGMP